MDMREKAEMAASVSRYSVNTWLTALRMVRDRMGSDGRCLLQAAEVPEVWDTLIAVGQDDPIKAANAILGALDAYRSQRLPCPVPQSGPACGPST